MWRTCLKTKMSCLVFLLVAGLLSSTAFFAALYFEKEFRESTTRHQFSLVSSVANEIDGKLLAAQNQIMAVGRGLTPERLADTGAAEQFLNGQKAVLQTFDNGIFLFSAAGRLLTGTGVESHMWGRDYSYREYFQVTVSTGKPCISKPFVSTQEHRHPIIMMTVPIVGEDGKIAAMLVGSLDLLGENFLARLIDLKVGEKGYLYLFSRDRTIILHPDRSRILRKDVPPEANHLYDRAVEGFEGSGATINSRGLHAIASFKQLQVTDWILGANFPVDEAFAPIIKARRYFLAGLGGMLVFSILTVWMFMEYLTMPLRQITSRASELAEGKTDLLPLQINTRDEIGILSGAFNHMMKEIEQRKSAIREQKDFAEDLLEHASVPVYVIDAGHRVLIWNRACEELTGIGAAEVKGTDGHWRAFYAEKRPCLADFVVSGELGNLSACYDLHGRSVLVRDGLQAEGWLTLANDRRRYLIFNAAPIHNKQGEIIAAIQTLEDFTERKEVEKRMERMAHFDSLTGLPNRSLFFDRLEQGVAAACRYGHTLGLLYLDLDGFKAINDIAGHDAGDRALIEVAQRLQGCVRRSDTVARVGGDEFTLVLTRVGGAHEAEFVAGEVLQALAAPIVLGERAFIIGGSIGISLCPADGCDTDVLIKKADTAMYQVKMGEKNNYRLWEEDAGAF